MKLLVIIILFFHISTFRCQIIDSVYLKNNSVFISNNQIDLGNQLNKSGLLNSKFKYYFIGEHHDKIENANLFLENFYWLNKYKGCRLIIFEISHKFEEDFNAYVNTGEDSIIRNLKLNYDENFSSEFSKILMGLYKYKNAKNIQLQIKCIDVEKDFYNTLERLKYYTDSLKSCNKVYEEINRLAVIGIKFYFVKSRIKDVLTQLSVIKNKINEIPDCEEKKYYTQKVKDIFSAYYYKKNKEVDLKLREDYIYKNFKQLIQSCPNQVFLAKYGYFHTNFTNKFNDIGEGYLVNRLVKNDTLENNICSIYSIYESEPKVYEIYFNRKQVSSLKKFSGNNLTLIKITNDKKVMKYRKYFNYCIFVPAEK